MSTFDGGPCSSSAPDPGGHTEDDTSLVQPTPMPAPTPARLLMPGGCAPKMIIVEDAPLIALDLAETMNELGFDVRATAFTHEQALAEIQQSVPDYAVIDLHLGASRDGRDGESLLSMLNARGCRCLVFSGDDDACRRVAELYPRVSVLTKPAQPGALAREIDRLRQLPAA